MVKKPVFIGGNRELFLDNHLIASLKKGARRVLHHPERREVVMTFDEPHEFGNASNYHSIVKDNDRYLFYYRGGGGQPTPDRKGIFNFVLCAAETTDGINFKRCPVNLLPEGSNVVLNNAMTDDLTPNELNTCPATSTVFLDTNPDCPREERFKMIVSDETPPIECNGMYLYVSADGYNFIRKSSERFDLDPESYYDSANLAFYDPNIGEYRLYYRHYKNLHKKNKPIYRTIMTCRTRDFVHFHDTQVLKFNPGFQALFNQGQQLYTNNAMTYFRAPHIYLGFPARYYDSGSWDYSVLNLPDLDLRTFRSGWSLREGTALTETVLISSRDGVNFTGFGEAFLRPGPQKERSSWAYGDCYFGCGMIPTKSHLAYGAPDELSFYFTEAYGSEGTVRVRRCSLRMDGFASINFPASGGILKTKPFVFSGNRLTLNLASGAFGRFKIGFQDENGADIPGFSLDDALHSTGDGLELTAYWKNGCDLSSLAGKTVVLTMAARDADLYSIQFINEEKSPELPELKVNNEDCPWR